MTKEERFQKKLFEKLNSFQTYEEKDKWINETAVDVGGGIGVKKISEFIDRYPAVKDSVNDYMLGVAIGNYGNPADEGYTFSQDISNQKLLDTLNAIEKNEEVFENRFGGAEGEEGMLRDVTGVTQQKAELLEEKDNILTGLKARKKEFHDRIPWYTLAGPEFGNFSDGTFDGGDLLDIGLGIPSTILFEGTNILQQIAAGWTDLNKEEGAQKVERANLIWDHENQRFGYGPEFKSQQKRLESVLNELEVLSQGNKEYQAYYDLNKLQDENLKTISNTIIDDLEDSGYATRAEIKARLSGE
tara:strand:- start:10995 stop:11897 length:903 start_codon:yes stop_codon:yes gene_type:complete